MIRVILLAMMVVGISGRQKVITSGIILTNRPSEYVYNELLMIAIPVTRPIVISVNQQIPSLHAYQDRLVSEENLQTEIPGAMQKEHTFSIHSYLKSYPFRTLCEYLKCETIGNCVAKLLSVTQADHTLPLFSFLNVSVDNSGVDVWLDAMRPYLSNDPLVMVARDRVVEFLQYTLVRERLASIDTTAIETCRTGRIPSYHVTQKTLSRKLHDIEMHLLNTDYALSIPVTRISQYYQAEIAECVWEGTTGLILLRIPLITRAYSSITVHSINVVPFHVDSMTAKWVELDHDRIGIDKNKEVYFLNQHSGAHLINSHTVKLFQIEDVSIARAISRNYASCLVSLVRGASPTTLNSLCKITTLNIQLDAAVRWYRDNVYILTGPFDAVNVRCGDGEDRFFRVDESSSSILHLPCRCELFVHKQRRDIFPSQCRYHSLEIVDAIPFFALNDSISDVKVSSYADAKLPS